MPSDTVVLSRATETWQKMSTPLMRAQKAMNDAEYLRYLREAKGHAEVLLHDLEELVTRAS